ncbi:MAG: hypothetical protein Q8M15_16865 [Bacteroidota bacterium]|nr:hypothetical protein [Bacteroidota bacterium]
MKIHIKKDKEESKGLFGLGQIKIWFTVHAHYELNDEEKQLLEKNKHVLKMVAFNFPFRGYDGKVWENNLPLVSTLVDEKHFKNKGEGHVIGCVFSNGELQELEDLINQGAKNLKAELYGGSQGTSVNEI